MNELIYWLLFVFIVVYSFNSSIPFFNILFLFYSHILIRLYSFVVFYLLYLFELFLCHTFLSFYSLKYSLPIFSFLCS